MKTFILTYYKGDREVINDDLQSLREMTPFELAEAYNREHKKEITGVRSQGLWLFAMHRVFMERFGENPITPDGNAPELTDPIVIVDGKIRYLEENPFLSNPSLDPSSSRDLKECKKKVEITLQWVSSFNFFCLLIKMSSIRLLQGDPVTFTDRNVPWGVINNNLVTISAKSPGCPEIGWLIVDVLRPGGFKADADYSVIHEDYSPGEIEIGTNPGFLPNTSCKYIPWLGSAVTDMGTFLWYREYP